MHRRVKAVRGHLRPRAAGLGQGRIQRSLGGGPHHAFVVEQLHHLVQRTFVHRLGHIQPAAGAQHPRHLVQRLGHVGQRNVVQAFEHQRQVEAGIGARHRRRAGLQKGQAVLGLGQVFGVLALVHLQPGHLAHQTLAQQITGQAGVAAAQLDHGHRLALRSPLLQWQQRSQHIHFVAYHGQGRQIG